MRAPPVLRGGFPARLAWLVAGLFLCACGVVSFLESELGLPPWDVLHQGLAEQTGISFGAANLVVSIVVLTLSWLLRAHIGLGTLLNALLIGTFVILLTALDPVASLSDEGIAVRLALLAVALPCFGIGSGFYIAAAMGAGPRDSLMLVTAKGLGIRIGAARTAVEVLALGVGFALGIGPAVELSFWLLARTPLAVASAAA